MAMKSYDNDHNKALQIMNYSWMEKPKDHYSKIPKQLYKSDFKEEYNDMITILNRVVGLDKAYAFEDWM